MNQPELGKKISELRKAKGLTQEKFAALCNINVRTLQRIESGIVNPRSYTLREIIKTLDCDSNDWFNNIQKKDASQLNSNIFFYLKKNIMRKLTIISIMSINIIGGISLINSKSEAQNKFDLKNDYTKTVGRDIVYLFPKGNPFYISNIKDTADYRFGEDLVQEFKNEIYLNGKFIRKVSKGDSILLDKSRKLHIRSKFWDFISSTNKGIIYRFPSEIEIDNLVVEIDNSEHLYLTGKIHIKEIGNKIYINDEFIGKAYSQDVVLLENEKFRILKGK